MEDAIRQLTFAILETQNRVDWSAIISAVCSMISLIAIVVLLIERIERKRPYLQVSFELVKNNLVCIVIRNIGDVPAKLKEMYFNEDFVSQLPELGRIHTQNRSDLNISIHPNQKWVIYLGAITPEVLKYENKKLEIVLKYTKINKNKRYVENETINFEDYGHFLVYISEIDELKEELKKLGTSLNRIAKELAKISKNQNQPQTQTYATVKDPFVNTVLTANKSDNELISINGEKVNEHSS